MVANDFLGKKRRPQLALGLCSLAVVAIGYAYSSRPKISDAANYQLSFTLPSGWKARPVTPGMAFIYENKQSHLSMRGAINNVISESNPTPELDASALIQRYQTITSENLTGWHYKLLDPVQAHGAEFQLIRRWTEDRCVVSAVAVRGNTTVIIALVGLHKFVPRVDEGMPAFRDYLANLSLVRYTFPE